MSWFTGSAPLSRPPDNLPPPFTTALDEATPLHGVRPRFLSTVNSPVTLTDTKTKTETARARGACAARASHAASVNEFQHVLPKLLIEEPLDRGRGWPGDALAPANKCDQIAREISADD